MNDSIRELKQPPKLKEGLRGLPDRSDQSLARSDTVLFPGFLGTKQRDTFLSKLCHKPLAVEGTRLSARGLQIRTTCLSGAKRS